MTRRYDGKNEDRNPKFGVSQGWVWSRLKRKCDPSPLS